jgi:hypothetical protein
MKESNMKSLKQLAIDATGTMEVRDAAGDVVKNDDGTAWSITFHSPGTKEYQKAHHAFTARKAGGMKALLGGAEKSDPAEETNAIADFLASVTISFNGFDYEGRTGHAGFRAAYADIEIAHVAEQANKFLGDRGNFWKKPAVISPEQSGTSPG